MVMHGPSQRKQPSEFSTPVLFLVEAVSPQTRTASSLACLAPNADTPTSAFPAT